MKLLFDTHAFMWWDSDPSLLSERVLELCQDPENDLILSVVTVWEMQIKSQLGKLKFDFPLDELVENQQRINGIQILPVKLGHVLKLNELPLHHKDPFDRLLIAQAKMEDAVLLSTDAIFVEYSVELVW
ncbi:MAG: type II toxin-antitoxin system VapC family toxin [Chloroflexi bacterium]|nr:type II toxin-antitoxin system VapC family toxin [Chloroflexota bacterium]